MLSTLLNTVFPVFFLIFLGWGYAKKRPDVSTRSLSDISLYIGIPAIILRDIAGFHTGDDGVWVILLASSAAIIIPTLIGFLWIKISRIEGRGLLLAIAFMNAINLAAPIISLHWGKEGIGIAVVFFTLQSICLFVFGVVLAAEKNKFREVLRMPYIYAIAAVLLMNKYNLHFPKAVENLIGLCADLAYPLMLIVMGIILGKVKTDSARGNFKLPLIAALIRITGGLAAVLLVVFIFDVQGITRDILIFYGIMPGAIASSLFAEKYSRDSSLVARSIFYGTMISLALIPVALLILK
jgi:predicted permease